MTYSVIEQPKLLGFFAKGKSEDNNITLDKFFKLSPTNRKKVINPILLDQILPIANETQKALLNKYARLSMKRGE